MVCLVTTNPAIFDEIAFTPVIEGGLGPVKIGVPVSEPEGVTGRRYAVCHPWAIDGPDVAWAEIYGSPDITAYPGLPTDWRYPEVE